jgi:hypothetical protein
MKDVLGPAGPAKQLLDDYIPETEMADIRGVKPRALRAERQRGEGPPYVKVNRRILYPAPGFRDWLKSIEQIPVRARRAG